MAKYQGHPSWNAWNVSLWLNNEKPLYRKMRAHISSARRTRQEAAKNMLADLREMGIYKTPDGAPYTVTSIRRAMAT